jgi:hypothetical protein
MSAKENDTNHNTRAKLQLQRGATRTTEQLR